MAVSLYTSRIILNVLGVVDFGLYNVVGGIVVMFTFLNSALSSGTQRFLAFELGSTNFDELRKVFSMSINMHTIIAFLVFILGETVGLWFLNTKLTIPTERLIAANWVYQFTILSFMVHISFVPYNAAIIVNEKMSVYAWISILEVFFKLLIVFMLNWFGFDKLKLYSVLHFISILIVTLLYYSYVRIRLKDFSYRFIWDKILFKRLIGYAGWNLWGTSAIVIFEQGVNILLNIFFGPAVNAARGIAYQIKGAVSTFAINLQIAFIPQIYKSYGASDLKYMNRLVILSSKYSFFLLLILTLPIFLETNIILKLWLGQVPEYLVIFTRLALIYVLLDGLSRSINSAALASGKIKKYQLINGFLFLFIIPLTYGAFKGGFSPQSTFYIANFIALIVFLARLLLLKELINFSVRDFFSQVVFYSFLVTITSSIIPTLLTYTMEESILRLIIVIIASLICTFLSVYFIGIKAEEKELLKSMFLTILKTSAMRLFLKKKY